MYVLPRSCRPVETVPSWSGSNRGPVSSRTNFALVRSASLHYPDLTSRAHPSLSQTGEETFFKVTMTIKMSMIFDAYASRKGVQANALRFLLDGERINADQTPKQLEMEEQDQIVCVFDAPFKGTLKELFAELKSLRARSQKAAPEQFITFRIVDSNVNHAARTRCRPVPIDAPPARAAPSLSMLVTWTFHH